MEDAHCSSHQPFKSLFRFICFKKPKSKGISNSKRDEKNGAESVRNPGVDDFNQPDWEEGTNKDSVLNANYGEEEEEEDWLEAEIKRMRKRRGSPRFLYTIKEEEKEDLESEDAKSTRSFRDAALPPCSPLNAAEVNKVMRSSPPPKFKFLVDAEEKLIKRVLQEAERKAAANSSSAGGLSSRKGMTNSGYLPFSRLGREEREGSFIRLIVGKNERELQIMSQMFPSSSSSRVQPLASSPLGSRELNPH